MFASDYGLVTRRLSALVDYQDAQASTNYARVPVFAVGRNQLYELFGLRGYELDRNNVWSMSVEYSDLDHAEYALVSMATRTIAAMVPPTGSVTLYSLSLFDVYATFEDACLHARNMLEHDSCDVTANEYSYEIWQICDDHDLWWEWETDSHIYWIEELREQWIAETTDGPHFYPTVVKNSSLMSDEYIQRLKAANEYTQRLMDENLLHLYQLREASELERGESMTETCYFCGCFLPGKHYSVKYHGDIELVCKDCYNAYVAHDYKLLRYRSADTFFCECCGRTMREEYYAQTLTGTYCIDCKAKHVNLGGDVSNLPEAERVAIAVDIEAADADWPRSCEHGDTYYTEGLE